MRRTWWKEAVCYQIYPRSFQDSNGDGIGDIQGIIQRLDYLKDLGIDVIWVCPMFQSPNADNGYDISDYQEIMEDFGNMADFDQLLKEVHRRGMKIIIDLVLNHTSDEHPWFIESRSSKKNSKRAWYIWREGRRGKEPNNWESIFGGSAWALDGKTKEYYLHLFSIKQPDLNWENQKVRKALYEMVNWWLEKGVDGFRIDAISHVKKRPGLPDMPNPERKKYVSSFPMHTNQEGIHTYLSELKEQTYGKYDVMTVGEANGVDVEGAKLWVGPKDGKMDMIFQFEHLGLWDYSHPALDIVQLKKVLTRWQKGLENQGWNALFIENHDKARVVSTWGNDRELWRESATAFAGVYFLMQGTPFIYQGQEIGMTNVKFPSIDDYNDIAAKNLYQEKKIEGMEHEEIMEIIWASSRDNSRTPMQWSNQKHAGFTAGTPWMKVNPNYQSVNVETQLAQRNSILSFYKSLIRLRKENAIFTYGQYDLLLEEDQQLFVYTRTLEKEQVMVMANLSAEEAAFSCESFTFGSLLLSNYSADAPLPAKSLVLKPYEIRVYRMGKD